jgi:hypothetical protein
VPATRTSPPSFSGGMINTITETPSVQLRCDFFLFSPTLVGNGIRGLTSFDHRIPNLDSNWQSAGKKPQCALGSRVICHDLIDHNRP